MINRDSTLFVLEYLLKYGLSTTITFTAHKVNDYAFICTSNDYMLEGIFNNDIQMRLWKVTPELSFAGSVCIVPGCTLAQFQAKLAVLDAIVNPPAPEE